MNSKINKLQIKNIAIVTCCLDDWGGSEELWARSLPYLKSYGNEVTIYKTTFNKEHPAINRIIEIGVKLYELKPSPFFLNRIGRQFTLLFKRMINRNFHIEQNHHCVKKFSKSIAKNRPELVVISQGINFDGLHYAYECLNAGIHYVIVSQKAVDFYWPHKNDKDFMRKTLKNAYLCCFVSYHNLRLTEDQFGLRLSNSKLIFNPIKVQRKPLKYPSVEKGYRLACIARLFILDKGQDILIKVLTQKKWRDRAITISFVGDGPDCTNLEEMVKLHKLVNIIFIKYQYDIENIWLNHHALILPSRSEGLPLSITEAMALGRTIITTNAGGSAEIVEDGVTGFIGEATVSSFSDAMERAWNNRESWDIMGINASEFIKRNIPEIPEKNFAELINKLTYA